MNARSMTRMALAVIACLLGCGAKQSPQPTTIKPRVIVYGTSIRIVNAEDEQVPIEIPFRLDTAELDPDSHGALDALAMFLVDSPELTLIEVQGHSDHTGTPEYNMELSVRRASSVIGYLVSKGVAPGRLRSKGFGATRPVARGHGEAVRRQNRRVEFVIVRQQ